jgi:hypothetical protein
VRIPGEPLWVGHSVKFRFSSQTLDECEKTFAAKTLLLSLAEWRSKKSFITLTTGGGGLARWWWRLLQREEGQVVGKLLRFAHDKFFWNVGKVGAGIPWQMTQFWDKSRNTKGGSITVPLTSCLTGWLIDWFGFSCDNWQFLFLFAKQTNPNQSNRRSMVQWYFPL